MTSEKDKSYPIGEESQIVLYQPDESIRLEVKVDAGNETVWLTQQQMADLFGVKQPAISKHLNNIFKERELDKDSVHSILEYTATDGKVYKTQFYNLDAIISVGYRVNSVHATVFRKWATRVLKDFLLKGYSVNQQLLAMQRQMDARFDEQSLRMTRIEDTQCRQQQQLDFFIRTSTPPAEMVFFEGDFYTARVALENLIRNGSWTSTTASSQMLTSTSASGARSLTTVGLSLMTRSTTADIR